MNISVLGIARDLRTNTPVVYAQLSIDDFLTVVGDGFENFTIQRRRENHKAYQRLKLDIKGGALLPSITLAVKPEKVETITPLFAQVEAGGDRNQLEQALSTPGQVDILDGLQRTYIIKDIKSEGHSFVEGQKILVEFWLESDLNNLIYRIIILNAGQKPMSIRHQIELLFMSLKTSIEGEIPNLEIYTERDNTRRHKPKKFALGVIVSAYQAFITSSSELQKDNVIATQLAESNALDSSEEEISNQFTQFTKYLTTYSNIDEDVTRIYRSAQVALDEVPADPPTAATGTVDIHTGAYANWLATENVFLAFFAAIAQFGTSEARIARVDEALAALEKLCRESAVGSDPLALAVFERLRAGANPRRINVGLATRKLLTNGFKEYFRESGEKPLADCWPLGAE